MAFPLLSCPAEIREQIYSYVLSSDPARVPPPDPDSPAHYAFDLSLLLVSRLVHKEAQKVFQDNVFVKITTSWRQSIEHIHNEGKVPIVCTGNKAAAFKGHHLDIYVDTPEAQLAPYHATVSMLTCLEDLSAFTQMWRWSDLNHQRGLNPHLQLTLTLQDPHIPGRKLPRHLQETLLLPFGLVRGLRNFSIADKDHKILPSISKRLAEIQKEPEPSAEECLEKCAALKEQGNIALSDQKYTEALELYNQAFAAIHITITGRHRFIHADGYFCTELSSGPHKGQRGDYIRIILRVQLVANILLAYLKTRNYAEAHFWGKRSITVFRQSMSLSTTTNEEVGQPTASLSDLNYDNEDPYDEENSSRWLAQLALIRVPAQREMGKIFFRTALAARELGERRDVDTLIRAAALYLPQDLTVQADLKRLNVEEEKRKRGDIRSEDGKAGGGPYE